MTFCNKSIHGITCLVYVLDLDLDKRRAAISYLVEVNLRSADDSKKSEFCMILLKDNVDKLHEISATFSGKYDRFMLELVSYALEEIHFNDDPLEIVNNALTKSGLLGCLLNPEDLNLFKCNRRFNSIFLCTLH